MSRWLPLAVLLACPLAHAEVDLPDEPAYRAGRATLRAALALERGQLDDAEREARHAVALRPDDIEAQLSLARVLAAAGRWGEVAAAAEAARRLDPSDPAALAFAGRAAVEAGDADAARAAYGALAQASQGVGGPLGLALVAARLDRDAEATSAALRDALRRAPTLDLSTLPLDDAFRPLAKDPTFLATLRTVLQTPPSPDSAPQSDE